MERKLSPFEQAIWRLSDAATFNFSIAAQTQGRFCDEALNDALHMVQLRHPMLQVRVVTTGHDAWFTSEDVPQFQSRAIEHDGRDWCSHVEEELNSPLSWKSGPLVRCRCLRRDDSWHEIVLTLHHLVGDGTSGILLMRDLIAAINHVAAGRPTSAWKRLAEAAPMDCRLPRRFQGIRGILSQGQQVLRSVTEDVRLGPPAVLPAHAAVSKFRRLVVMPHSFCERDSTALRQRAKEQAASLHGAISAAIVLSTVAEFAPGRRVSIKHRMPMNMRSLLSPPAEEEIGMFASMLFARVNCKESDDFWSLAAQIANQISGNVRTKQAATSVRMVPTLFRLVRGRKLPLEELVCRWRRHLRSATALTNLGEPRIALPAGPVQLTALRFIASPGPLGDFTCAAMSHRGRLQCNFTFAVPAFSIKAAQRMAGSVITRLNDALAELDHVNAANVRESLARAG